MKLFLGPLLNGKYPKNNVVAWNSRYPGGDRPGVNVILVDWSKLAAISSLDFYDKSAKTAIDVGEYLGLCLAKLSVRLMSILEFSIVKIGPYLINEL